MKDPLYFRPHALAKAPIVRESRLVSDTTMPLRDWSKYDEPAWIRMGKKIEFVELPTFRSKAA